MTAHLAPSAKPPWSVTCWADDVNVYLEVPGTPPHILKYPLCEAGLSKALWFLRDVYNKTKPKSPNGKPKSAVIRRFEGKREVPQFSEESRATAREVLKKLKII